MQLFSSCFKRVAFIKNTEFMEQEEVTSGHFLQYYSQSGVNDQK
jgi:hypothetical protein